MAFWGNVSQQETTQEGYSQRIARERAADELARMPTRTNDYFNNLVYGGPMWDQMQAASEQRAAGAASSGAGTPGNYAPPQAYSPPAGANPFTPQTYQAPTISRVLTPQEQMNAAYRPQLETYMKNDASGGYAGQLQQLMQGQFSTSDPSYAWRFQQGQQAAQRSLGARGLNQSGAAAAELQAYGQQAASQEYGAQFQRTLQALGVSENSFQSGYNRLAELAGMTSGQQTAANALNLGYAELGARNTLAYDQLNSQNQLGAAELRSREGLGYAGINANQALGYANLNSQDALGWARLNQADSQFNSGSDDAYFQNLWRAPGMGGVGLALGQAAADAAAAETRNMNNLMMDLRSRQTAAQNSELRGISITPTPAGGHYEGALTPGQYQMMYGSGQVSPPGMYSGTSTLPPSGYVAQTGGGSPMFSNVPF